MPQKIESNLIYSTVLPSKPNPKIILTQKSPEQYKKAWSKCKKKNPPKMKKFRVLVIFGSIFVLFE
jgi:hypothetical protein